MGRRRLGMRVKRKRVEFRSSGVQEFRSSGVQEFRSSGVQEFRSSGVQELIWVESGISRKLSFEIGSYDPGVPSCHGFGVGDQQTGDFF
jgi:hypothetical protein